MGPPNIRDLLTSFSPSSDFLAISSGDGRIKVWDTLKGQVQTEFADITSTDDGTDLYNDSGSGHLSLDYTCMKWLPLEKKKKRKIGCSLLVLGTGSGDVLALDVSAGQLKWRLNDCHPAGVSAISFSADRLCIYTAGVDGMICQTDPATGRLLGKFRASTKAISSMVLSHDGKILATAAGQLKVFNCSDNKKIQKFSGHPGAVRCMIFSEDGKYVLSSAVGEKSIAVWKIDGSKKQSTSCVLSMEHPAVFLDSKCIDGEGADDAGLYVLAISELGLCYFWYGRNIEDLRRSKPTRISLSPEAHLSKYHKSAVPMVFAAKLKGIEKPGSGQVFLAYGSLVKPAFEKVLVQYGVDIILNSTLDGILLPIDQAHKSQKGQKLQAQVTALDRANAEDALLPIPKLHEFKDKKRRRQHSTTDPDEEMTDNLMNRGEATSMVAEDDEGKVEEDGVATCMEDQLRSLGILGNKDNPNNSDKKKKDDPNNLTLSSTLFNDEYFEANISQKKMNAAVLSMESEDAYKLLTFLVNAWKSRPGSAKHALPWISTILVNHSRYILSQEQYTPVLDPLYKLTESKCIAVQPLIQLSGRMQLVMTQINKAGQNKIQISSNDHRLDESESEDEEDVDEFVYKEEESESQSGSEDDI